MPFSFPLWALDDTTPWQLPVPFVGPVLRTFGGLLLLANVNALYERMGIFGYQKAFPIYALNLVLVRADRYKASGERAANCFQIGLVFLAISVFCSRRLANYYHDWVTVGTTLTVTILWVVIFALNMGIVIAGFVRCNVRHLRKNSPLDSGSYCHFFGNPELAEKSGWDGKAWPAYYWANLALFLMVAFWQLCVTIFSRSHHGQAEADSITLGSTGTSGSAESCPLSVIEDGKRLDRRELTSSEKRRG